MEGEPKAVKFLSTVVLIEHQFYGIPYTTYTYDSYVYIEEGGLIFLCISEIFEI